MLKKILHSTETDSGPTITGPRTRDGSRTQHGEWFSAH